jgi:hypothetical protein
VETGFFKQQRGVEKGRIEQIDGLNLRTGPLFHAAFEHMAEVYNRFIDVLCPDRSAVKRIIFSGGVCWKNPLFVELMIRKASLPGLRPPLADESLAGLLRLALVCSGRCGRLEESGALLTAGRLS